MYGPIPVVGPAPQASREIETIKHTRPGFYRLRTHSIEAGFEVAQALLPVLIWLHLESAHRQGCLCRSSFPAACLAPPFRSYGEKKKSGLDGLLHDLFRLGIPVKLFPAPVRLGRHDAYHGV